MKLIFWKMEQKELSKNRLKYLQLLKLKKYRLKYGCFLAEGQKVVKELLDDKKLKIKALYALSSWYDKDPVIPNLEQIELFRVSEAELDKISSLQNSNQVIAECQMMPPDLPLNLKGWILYLDGLQDPGNVGTIIRTADWFDCAGVVLRKGSVDIYNPKTLQAGMGSIGRLPIAYMHAHELRDHYPDHTWWLATLTGRDVRQTKFEQPGILVIGHESSGISNDFEDFHTRAIVLPKLTKRKIDSLNAASATSALLAMITLRTS